MKRLAGLLLVVACCGTVRVASPEELSAAQIVARHVEARGGAARWREIAAIEMTGTYSAFSKRSEFRLIRKRGDLFRLDFDLLDSPSVRARDAEGPWMRHGLLKPEAGYVGDHPYKAQLEREALFPPVLLDYAARGIGVESLGAGDVDGVATLDLKLTFPDGSVETWHLDALSFLEVAIDSQVVDHTQAGEPMSQRAFFDDFREVAGLTLPHQVELEFGARLESMTVVHVDVAPVLDDSSFSPPATAAAGRESEKP